MLGDFIGARSRALSRGHSPSQSPLGLDYASGGVRMCNRQQRRIWLDRGSRTSCVEDNKQTEGLVSVSVEREIGLETNGFQ